MRNLPLTVPHSPTAWATVSFLFSDSWLHFPKTNP